MSKLKLKSDYKPTGDQPAAIKQLIDGLAKGNKQQTLLGVTGSGKSVVGGTKILCQYHNKAWYIPIGELDKSFEGPLSEANGSVQALSLDGMSTIALNPLTGKTSKSSVAELSRHKYLGDL